MKLEINVPKQILEPAERLAAGLKIPLERVVETMVMDWIGKMDMELAMFGKAVTPGYRAFDMQFTDDTPNGYEPESSYELSRSTWQQEFLSHHAFYQARADRFEAEDSEGDHPPSDHRQLGKK